MRPKPILTKVLCKKEVPPYFTEDALPSCNNIVTRSLARRGYDPQTTHQGILMRFLTSLSILALTCAATGAQAQTATNMAALRGLVPVSTLNNTPQGQAALAADETVTGAIQQGTAQQPLLLAFPDQQAKALWDAYITFGNGDELAEGYGSKLGAAYNQLATYTSTDDGKTAQFTSVSKPIADLIIYSAKLTASDAGAGKYFFANETTDGKTPVSAAAMAIMTQAGGITDIFGKSNNDPAGPTNTEPYGDARPFQTEKTVTFYTAVDHFGVTNSNKAYLYGPVQDLQKSPSYPSGHTTYAYTESLVLAEMLPARFPQMIVRAAEYGNDRDIVGAHYAMDIIGGRTLASYDIAHLLANDPDYVGQKEGKVTIADYKAALKTARADLKKALETTCGGKIRACAKEDTSRFADPAKNAAFYESTQTYGLPVVYPATAGKVEDVAKIAPEAGYLLTAAFPHLSLKQADHILTITEGPGGGFLDNGSDFGLYSRLDLYKASLLAQGRSHA